MNIAISWFKVKVIYIVEDEKHQVYKICKSKGEKASARWNAQHGNGAKGSSLRTKSEEKWKRQKPHLNENTKWNSKN